MVDVDLSPKQRDIMEYLIGSLDDDGLLRKDAGTLSDDLPYIITSTPASRRLTTCCTRSRRSTPPGWGARDLRECLMLQIRRKPKSDMRSKMEEVIAKCYDEFMNKRWDKISAQARIRRGDGRQGARRTAEAQPEARLGPRRDRRARRAPDNARLHS